MQPTRPLYWRACVLALVLAACGHSTPPPAVQLQAAAAGHVRLADTTTTTQAPPPPTTLPPAPPRPPAKVARVGPRTAAPVADPAFWRRLANCESRNGASGTYVGYFQLTWANAARVGIGPSSSYDEQVAGAQRWLAIIGGRGGTTAGWPVCWWRALAG